MTIRQDPSSTSVAPTAPAARKSILDKDVIARLRSNLRGALITPIDADYETARRVYNGMIDRHPAAVVRCVDVADVMTAVNFARQNHLDVAVRGGGHNPNGFATCDDGIVIDLSRMRSVHVDPAHRVALVDGGCTWADVDHATHAFALAAPGGVVSSTGVGGLTLGGGIGHLARAFGLSIDNLLSAEVVLSDGQFVTATEDQNADLFWALRGGGGNFGVVTSFEFQLHPVGNVLAGPVLYPIEAMADVLGFFREYIATAPFDMSAFFAVLQVPPGPPFPVALHNKVVCALVTCFVGPMDQGIEVMQPLRTFGPPLLDLVGEMPFPALQSMFDPLLPPGMQHYWKADFVHELTDAAIAEHVKFGPRIPNISSAMHIYPTSGAVQRVPRDATAYSYRDANFVHVIAAMHPDPATMPANIGWVRDYWSGLHPHSAPGAYVNFLMDEAPDRIRSTYRENFDRLVAVKRRYDPTNLFRLNQNIAPNAGKTGVS